MASAIAAARQQINDVGADGDLDGATPPGEIDLDDDSVADPIELPDGKVICPPKHDRLRAAGHAGLRSIWG